MKRIAVIGLLRRQVARMKVKHPGVIFVPKGRHMRMPSGCDVIVCSRFMSHKELGQAKMCNPHAKVLNAHGGLTSISKAIEEEEDEK